MAPSREEFLRALTDTNESLKHILETLRAAYTNDMKDDDLRIIFTTMNNFDPKASRIEELLDEINNSAYGQQVHQGNTNPEGWDQIKDKYEELRKLEEDMKQVFEQCLNTLGIKA
ncbi:hypothetical protein M426DRAFT_14233 [Hypoxylon sp. CI-4A]|nr:hypothetical protein M426DRAFT_14233 [Hypoxylon sp. CI-4A]